MLHVWPPKVGGIDDMNGRNNLDDDISHKRNTAFDSRVLRELAGKSIRRINQR